MMFMLTFESKEMPPEFFESVYLGRMPARRVSFGSSMVNMVVMPCLVGRFEMNLDISRTLFSPGSMPGMSNRWKLSPMLTR